MFESQQQTALGFHCTAMNKIWTRYNLQDTITERLWTVRAGGAERPDLRGDVLAAVALLLLHDAQRGVDHVLLDRVPVAHPGAPSGK
jgi:hypothetical protein